MRSTPAPYDRLRSDPLPARETSAGIFYWLASFVVLLGYSASVGVGGPATYMPLLIMMTLFVGAYPRRYLQVVLQHKVLILVPFIALLSTIWSDYRSASLKLSLELIAHTIIAVSLAATISLRTFASAFLCALIAINVAGILFGGRELIYTSGEFVSNGFFGSKNNFALFSSFLFIVSACCLIDRGFTSLTRAVALFGLTVAIALFGMTKSLGAIIACSIASSAIPLAYFLREFKGTVRPLLVIGFLLLTVLLMTLVYLLLGDTDAVLRLVGKSSDLTGRAVLWARAQRLMEIKPLFGTGYQAFWVQGNPEAEALWKVGRVTARSGFHFHNTYYAVGVELGYIGIVAQIVTIMVILFTVTSAYLKMLRIPYVLLMSLYIMLVVRLPSEVDGLSPFSPGAFLSAIIYVYASQALRQRQAHKMLPRLPHGEPKLTAET